MQYRMKAAAQKGITGETAGKADILSCSKN